uniref:Uncharacterized protein n=1 Tax=Rhizophora mucronata TaxID=61149 RepID=A0A2P2N056_RHIMU
MATSCCISLSIDSCFSPNHMYSIITYMCMQKSITANKKCRRIYYWVRLVVFFPPKKTADMT